jgi:hypothetical protein
MRVSIFPQVHFHLRPHWLRGPPYLLVNGQRGTFPAWVKRPEREAENLTSTSVEIMNACYIYTPQHAFIVYTRLTLPTLEPNSVLRGDKLVVIRPHYCTVKRQKLV